MRQYNLLLRKEIQEKFLEMPTSTGHSVRAHGSQSTSVIYSPKSYAHENFRLKKSGSKYGKQNIKTNTKAKKKENGRKKSFVDLLPPFK